MNGLNVNTLAKELVNLHVGSDVKLTRSGGKITARRRVTITVCEAKRRIIILGDHIIANIYAIEEKAINFMKAFQRADIESINSNTPIKEALKVIISFYASSSNFNANYSTHGTRYIIHDGAQEVLYSINSTNKLNDWIERFIKESSCDIQRFSLIQSAMLDIDTRLKNDHAIYKEDKEIEKLCIIKCRATNGEAIIKKPSSVNIIDVIKKDIKAFKWMEKKFKEIENDIVSPSLEEVDCNSVISAGEMEASL